MSTDNKSREEKLVETIADGLNSFGIKYGTFCDFMAKQHRYLQNEFTILCTRWLEYCSSDEYKYDDRNKYSHEIGKKFVEGIYKQ